MNAKTAQTDAKKAEAPQTPLFYAKPMLLEAQKHKDLGLNKEIGFDFASNANAIPINLVEFPQIAHYYPIAFARDAAATPVAVVGVRNEENLFVNKKGEWQEDVYVPAYARRYPFILSENPEKTQLSLCIDDTEKVLDKKGDKFFDDKGGPTDMAKNAMEFCRSYHMAAQQTMNFGKALAEADLLVDRAAEITLKDGQRVSFSGFRIIDEGKFNKLPAETFVQWRDKGWLAGVYAHLFSGLNWGHVTKMLNDQIPDSKKNKA